MENAIYDMRDQALSNIEMDFTFGPVLHFGKRLVEV